MNNKQHLPKSTRMNAVSLITKRKVSLSVDIDKFHQPIIHI